MVKNKFRQAFTLIELLIVIAIIGILVTVVAVNTSKARVKSRVNAAKIDVSAMLVAYENYKASHLSLTSAIANSEAINTDSSWNTFWSAVDSGNTYVPPTNSGITYKEKTINGKGVFCAYGGDVESLGTGKYLIGKGGNVYEGNSSDCSV